MTQPDPRTALSNQLADVLTNHSVQPEVKREITVTFRVSNDEKARLEQRCSGVVQSDYIRARLFDYSLPRSKSIIPEVNRQCIYELKKIGNNINQQTKAINEAVKVGYQPLNKEAKEYLQTLKELADILEQTHRQLTQTIE
jgi:Bacterial mobilisation protein (MobC)